MTELRVDLSNLRKFGQILTRVAPESKKEFLAALELGGELVAKEAERKASFSKRIPGSVRVQRRGTTVKVQAGGAGVGDAAPLEHHGLEGKFRHPVFGNKEVWVDQPARPFLTPAVDAKIGDVIALVEGAVDITIARILT